jgi:putative ABC transport system permease protein
MILKSAAALAWRIVRHNPDRLIRSVLGITFAILLMLVQLGFRNALLDSSTQFLKSLNTDIVVMASDKQSFLQRGLLPRDRLYQAQSVEGVKAAYPLYLNISLWKNLEDGTLRPIRVLGFVLDDPVFLSKEVNDQSHLLRIPGTALMDSKSKDYYGTVGPGPAEIDGRAVEVVGTFPMGTDFQMDGNIIVGEETYFGIARSQRDRSIQMALVELEDDADPDVVTDAINRVLPWDAAAYQKETLVDRELAYWNRKTPVGIIFMAGMAVGFVAGIVILTQILFTLISDHLSEFATLKAMGYNESYLVWVVLLMAFFLSILGLILALILGIQIYKFIAVLTGLPMALTMTRIGLMVICSMALCAGAGLMALRRVLTLDPAEVFR